MWFALLPLAGGAGLAAYIFARLSLWLGIALAMVMGSLAAWAVRRRLPGTLWPAMRRRAFVGVVAGITATLAYDLARLVLVHFAGLSYWPFDVFPVFGRLLLGTQVNASVATLAGLLFHFSNGAGFAVAFMFLFRRPGIWPGLLWAAILELCMVSLYPSWLNLKALDEFLSVSILGHAAYGLVLGSLARYGMAREGGRAATSQTMP